MQLGIFAKTFAGIDPLTVLSAANETGYATVQYNMSCSGLAAMPDSISEAAVQAIASASKQTGISIAAVSATFNMIHPDRSIRAKGLTRLALLGANCAAMGTTLITLCSGTRDPEDQWRDHPDNNTPEAWRDLKDSMATALDIAERFGIALGIEPELANVVNTCGKAKQLIAEMQSSRLKIIFDAANLFEIATQPEQQDLIARGLDLVGEHIVMAHAKDRNSDGSFATAGRGTIDFKHYFACLKSAGFNGPIITHGLQDHEARSVAEFLKSLP